MAARNTQHGIRFNRHASQTLNSQLPTLNSSGFTLIEIMVVVGIMGIVMAVGVPFAWRALRREPLNQALRDVEEVCSNARARAIMQGTMTEVIFHPKERRLEVASNSSSRPGGTEPGRAPNPYHVYSNGAEVKPEEPIAPTPPRDPSVAPGTGLSAQISDRVVIRALEINMSPYTDSEEGRVRFYPNGTSDEMLLILNSDRNEQRGITLEVTTGFASVLNQDDLQKLLK